VSHAERLLLLGLDAADHDVVQRLIGEGRMPNLAALAAGGVSARLRSPAGHYAGGVWPTFYTGRPVADHGVYHNKQWRPSAMRVEVPTLAWTRAVPFWERLPAGGGDSLILDVPMVLDRPRPVGGAYLGGWGTHDLIHRGAWPPELWGELVRRFGGPVMPREEFGWPTDASLDRLGATLRQATDQMRDLTLDLLARRPWRLACTVFGALHRGGHYLWDRSQVAPGTPPTAPGTPPTEPLLELYQHVDAAVGRILARAPAGTRVIVFAVHGMGPNPGWSDLLPDLLGRLDAHRSGRAPRRGLLYRLRQSVPHHWQRRVLDRLPATATQRLIPLWSRRMCHWPTTRTFPLPMDETGYLRVNLRGREEGGIVAPGPEYDETCAELEALVSSLSDEATGAPIAGPTVRAWRDAVDAPSRDLVPDLIIPFAGPPAATVGRLVSPRLPGFRYHVPPRLPSGRSGNHRDHGWLIAGGPGIAAGGTLADGDVLDLLPTIQATLGLPLERGLPGRPIVEVAGR
jgi:predicted AlkP superfamily phosphohydrolase/phosphomutase